MNYSRGRQMIIHDPRLAIGKPPRPVRPPLGAMNTWTVNVGDPLPHILGHAAAVAAGAGKLDALHFMAHGMKAWLLLGADKLTWSNVDAFTVLDNKVRVIVIYGCQFGSDEQHGSDGANEIGSAIAQLTGAKVIICRQKQNYYVFAPNDVIDFGKFEGEVYIYHPSGGHTVVFSNSESGKAQINMEKYIFI